MLSVGALLAASLAAGVTTTLWQARRADRRFEDVRRLAHTFIFDVHDAVEKLPGSTAARQLLVSNALTYLESLATEAEGDQSLQRELATSFEKMADVLGRPNTPNLGDLHGAVAAYRRAQAARDRVLADNADDVSVRRDRALTSSKMARVLYLTGDLAAGLQEARAATRLEEVLAAADTTPAARLRLGASYTTEGFLLGASKATVNSIDRFRHATAILGPLQAEAGDAYKLQLARTYSDFGQVLCEGAPAPGLVPNPRGCLEMFQRSNAIEEPLAQADPSNVRLQRNTFAGAVQVGEGLVGLGDLSAAIPYFRRGCAVGERLAGMDAADLQAQSDFATACEHLGTALAKAGSGEEALTLLRRSSQIL